LHDWSSALIQTARNERTGRLGSRERYSRRQLLANAAIAASPDREAHEKMGFHGGWGLCTDQLAALVAKL
jgi:uncharacterized protein YndB with AHSA1/START domain